MSDFRYINNKKKKLLVTFMGYHVPKKGRELPFTWNFLNKQKYLNEYDLIQLRDLRATWYIRGIKHLAPSVEKLVMWLEYKIKGYDDISFIGSSMGGFASILYGTLLIKKGYNISIQSFAPQTFLNGTGRGILISENILNTEGVKISDLGEYSNLGNIVTKKIDLTVHLGKHNNHDIKHLEVIKPHVKYIYWHNTEEHQVAKIMKDNGSLYPYFDKLLL